MKGRVDMEAMMPGSQTLEEILSQPSVWKKSLQRLSDRDRQKYPLFKDYDQVLFTGCGSTYYLSLWAARLCEKATGLICRAVPASDLLLFPEAWLRSSNRSLLVAVSRSAETTETIRALKAFQAGKYGDAIVVTCYRDRTLAQLTPMVVDVPDSQEQSVAQTRSFTNMMLAIIWLLGGPILRDLPGLYFEAGEKLINEYSQLARQIGEDDSISKFFFLGSGPLYGLASEAMLKMKEMSLAHSESFHTLEFRHGPMSLVDRGSLIIGLTDASMGKYEFALLHEMRSKGARTLGLLDQDDPTAGDALDNRVLFQSGISELWRAPLYLPILQLIAYNRSIYRGLNPDRPLNLSSVVVLHE
jgi:glutamine---fructose-6-phosphate transaminase (isomerizing)